MKMLLINKHQKVEVLQSLKSGVFHINMLKSLLGGRIHIPVANWIKDRDQAALKNIKTGFKPDRETKTLLLKCLKDGYFTQKDIDFLCQRLEMPAIEIK